MANLFVALTSPLWVTVFVAVYLVGCGLVWLVAHLYPSETDHD